MIFDVWWKLSESMEVGTEETLSGHQNRQNRFIAYDHGKPACIHYIPMPDNPYFQPPEITIGYMMWDNAFPQHNFIGKTSLGRNNFLSSPTPGSPDVWWHDTHVTPWFSLSRDCIHFDPNEWISFLVWRLPTLSYRMEYKEILFYMFLLFLKSLFSTKWA